MREFSRRSWLLSVGGALSAGVGGAACPDRKASGQGRQSCESCQSCESGTRVSYGAGSIGSRSGRDGVPSDEKSVSGDDSIRRLVAKCHGDIDAVRDMLKRHPEWCHAVWDWGAGDFESPLGAAAHSGRADIAELLMEFGASPDLFVSAMLGHLGTVRRMTLLVDQWRRAEGSHRIPLVSHAIAGGPRALRVVRFLLDQGVDVNASSRLGYTPLMSAACFDNHRAAGWLLDCGADPGRRNVFGLTAEQIALKRGHDRVAARLAALQAASR